MKFPLFGRFLRDRRWPVDGWELRRGPEEIANLQSIGLYMKRCHKLMTVLTNTLSAKQRRCANKARKIGTF